MGCSVLQYVATWWPGMLPCKCVVVCVAGYVEGCVAAGARPCVDLRLSNLLIVCCRVFYFVSVCIRVL